MEWGCVRDLLHYSNLVLVQKGVMASADVIPKVKYTYLHIHMLLLRRY